MSTQEMIPFIAVGVALVLIVLRNRRPRTLRPQWMWVTPAVVVPLMGLGLWASAMAPGVPHVTFHAADFVVMALGGVLGGFAGWWRGKMTTIEKHEDGTLKAQASPIGIILIVALMAGRRTLAALLEPHAAAFHLTPITIPDALLVFILVMILVQRVEMYIRARRVQAGGGDSHVEAVA